LYVFADKKLVQVTEDDSWAASVLARDPQIDPIALLNHPMRNALTNVVGSRARTTVHVSEHVLAGGELLALTTDGVHGVLSELSLAQVLGQGDAKRIASGLVDAALSHGSRDNCTAVVAEYVPS
jgi:protein phosphatase